MLEVTKNESHPDSKTQDFLKVLNSSGGTPMEELSPAEARKVLESAQKSAQFTMPKCEVQKKEIDFEGEKLLLYVIRPQGVKEKLPVFMFFHGGGWVIGDYATHERFVKDLVIESGLACVFVEYDRSPEAPYPKALNQCYFATKWVAEHGDEINVDGSHLAVCGNSAGGNLAAAVTLMAKEKKVPTISFQILMWPVTNANFETESYKEFENDHFLTGNMMKWFWSNYIQDKNKRNEIFASPLLASSNQLKGLPPALFQIAECDVLRDEGEAYARRLDDAGVSVTTTRYVGMIHDFGLLNALSDIPEVRSALRQAGQELKNYLVRH